MAQDQTARRFFFVLLTSAVQAIAAMAGYLIMIKPLLIEAGMEMRGALVFFALIGGLSAFGAIGLLIGPLVVALFLALLRMYVRDFGPALTERSISP